MLLIWVWKKLAEKSTINQVHLPVHLRADEFEIPVLRKP